MCVCFIGASAAHSENVSCDPTIDTSIYFCRGWQDGVGKYGSRVHFIARMMGDEDGDDFGFEIVPLGDINGDGRGDFMVSVRNECEWRIYLGDTIISKNSYLAWPKHAPPYPCTPSVGRFVSTPDISGDGQPDLFRSRSATTPPSIEIYFAGSAFDTLPDLIIRDSNFIFPGAAGKTMDAGLDLNGDGEPDIVLGDVSYLAEGPPIEHGRAYVHYGGNGLDTIADLLLTDTVWTNQPRPGALGGAIALLPSINGDGSAELILGRRQENSSSKEPPGRVDIFFGGPSMDTVRDLSFIGPDTAYDPDCDYIPVAFFGGRTENVGDVNLDGFDDLLVSGSGCVPSYVYFGGPDFDTIVDLRLIQPWPTPHGEGDAATVLGDIDGDGHRDFCTVRHGRDFFRGVVNVHFARTNLTGVVDWSIAGEDWFLANDEFGRSTVSVGDVNGDGFDDIAAGSMTSSVESQSEGAVFIFAGYNPDINSGVFDEPETPLPTNQPLIESIAPNPFNSTTLIYLSASFTNGSVAIYNILGQEVRRLSVGSGLADKPLRWDGSDAGGNPLASGMYFARATDGHTSETHKLVLLK